MIMLDPILRATANKHLVSVQVEVPEEILEHGCKSSLKEWINEIGEDGVLDILNSRSVEQNRSSFRRMVRAATEKGLLDYLQEKGFLR